MVDRKKEHRLDSCDRNPPRQEWVRPAVYKIKAGSAEIGSDVITDAGVTKS